MFCVDGTPLVERFELLLINLRTPTGLVRVPIVNQWIELQLAITNVPDENERHTFFADLQLLCTQLRTRLPELRWYFLHKSPGLKLRFRVGRPDAGILELLIGTITGWSLPWLEAVGIGSVFDQAELLAAPFRDDVELMLTRGADCHVMAALANRRCTEDQWAELLVKYLLMLGLDKWLAYEALSRLRRLRAADLSEAPSPRESHLDPSELLNEPFPEFSAGFDASLSLLQGINLLFNMWALDAAAQNRILNKSCADTLPSLLAKAADE